VITSPAQVMLLAADLYEDVIDEESIAVASMFLLQSPVVYNVEYDAPETN
jgi:hypothetical protein